MSYYPYLRGRMYDLLALKALCENDQLGSDIVPIIEKNSIAPNLFTPLLLD